MASSSAKVEPIKCKMSTLYEVLGIETTATSVEIKKAYRKLALSHHPDKVPEEEREQAEIRFKEISAAYEILSDDQKRANYDQYGDANGPTSNGYGGYEDAQEFSPEDFFQFFGGGNPGMNGYSTKRESNRTEDALLDINVTLSDLYIGKTVKITSTRDILCKTCKGEGYKQGAKTKVCAICHGQGQVRKIKRLGRGMAVQEYVDCTTCNGKGHIYRAKDKCKKCNGSTLQEETKILEFYIEKGSQFGDTVVLKGESDEAYGKTTGDVILTIHEKESSTKLERIDNDLYANLDISLAEALCGFKDKIVLKHLDDRLLKISIPTGKVLRPNQYLKIPREGFPVKNSFYKKGDLYLKLNIEFPPDYWFSEKSELQNVLNILPGSSKKSVVEDDLLSNNVDSVDFSIVEMKDLPNYGLDDESEPNHNTGSGCAQQ